jgi:hypothetical protein
MITLWSLWTYQDKLYRVTGFSRGAGALKGQDLVHYEPCYECEFSEFTRERGDFAGKFMPFEGGEA